MEHKKHISWITYERFGNRIDTHRFISDGAKNITIPEDVPDEELDEKEMYVRRRDLLKKGLGNDPDNQKMQKMLAKYTKLADDAYHHFGLDYNLKDTRIVEMLEDETALLSLVFTVAYRGGSNFKDAFGTVGIWDTTLYRKIMSEGRVPPVKNVGNSELGVLEGGFVKVPQVGMHEWVVSFDLDSLYPHLMMGSNLSPETLVDEKYLENIANQDECGTEVKKSDAAKYLAFRMVDGKISDINQNDILQNNIDDELSEALKTLNLALTANGALYTRDDLGVIPSIIEEYYAERKKVKKEMLSVESDLEEIKNEISRRNLEKKEIENNEYRGEQKRYKI